MHISIRLAAAVAALACATAGHAPHLRAAASPTPGHAPGVPVATARGATGVATDSSWQWLFDGADLSRWRGYRNADITGWHVQDGALTKSGNVGDLITRRTYGDFELEFEWKVGREGNSGVFYRATEEYDEVYWSGPEFQLLDDANTPDGKSPLTAAGSNYAVYPVTRLVARPAGEWNTARIVVRGNHVEHWLNGQRVVEYELNGPDWTARVKKSKFAAWPDYGKAPVGYIGIQGDHPGSLWLRHIRIRELP